MKRTIIILIALILIVSLPVFASTPTQENTPSATNEDGMFLDMTQLSEEELMGINGNRNSNITDNMAYYPYPYISTGDFIGITLSPVTNPQVYTSHNGSSNTSSNDCGASTSSNTSNSSNDCGASMPK